MTCVNSALLSVIVVLAVMSPILFVWWVMAERRLLNERAKFFNMQIDSVKTSLGWTTFAEEECPECKKGDKWVK